MNLTIIILNLLISIDPKREKDACLVYKKTV